MNKYKELLKAVYKLDNDINILIQMFNKNDYDKTLTKEVIKISLTALILTMKIENIIGD